MKVCRTVKKIYYLNKGDADDCLIRAIVIGIAYFEKYKKRSNWLQRPFANGLRNLMLWTSIQCGMYRRQCQINELEKLENYFKYRIIIIDNDYKINKKIIYINNNNTNEKTIYLQHTEYGYNVIESMKSYLKGRYFCEQCIQSYNHKNSLNHC